MDWVWYIVDDGVIVGIDGSDDEGAIVVVVMDPDWVGGCASWAGSGCSAICRMGRTSGGSVPGGEGGWFIVDNGFFIYSRSEHGAHNLLEDEDSAEDLKADKIELLWGPGTTT